MKLHQLFEMDRDEGLRETSLNDLQVVINYYRRLVNKWATSFATNTARSEEHLAAGMESEAEYRRQIAARAEVDRKKNQKTLDFLQTMYNLVAERSKDGDQEAIAFYQNSLPPESWLPQGPSVHIPRSMRTLLGIHP